MLVLCQNGYRSASIVANTIRHVDRCYAEHLGSGARRALSRAYFEVTCAEFAHFEHGEFGRAVNMLDRLFAAEDQGGFIAGPLVRDAIVDAIQKAEIASRLETLHRSPVLLGIGFTDPSGVTELDDVVAVSAIVNTPEWHAKVRAHHRPVSQL